MYLPVYLGSILSIPPFASSLVPRAPAGIQVTNHVLPLVAVPYPHPITPSSKHLHKRRRNGPRQDFPIPGLVPPPFAPAPFAPPAFAPPFLPPSVAQGPPPIDMASPPIPPTVEPALPAVDVSSPPIDVSPPSSAPDATVEPDALSAPIGSSSPAAVTGKYIEQSVDTLSGRVYMTNVSLAGRPYTLILDTGSSDTWIAASDFRCTSRVSHARLPQRSCGFGELYDVVDSTTYDPIPGRTFSVKYSDGEYLMGNMGVEELSVGDLNDIEGHLTVRQTIGVVEKGWWMGDGRSSGLMGLAYPTLASNYRDLNYTTVVGSLFDTHQVPPIFSLALSRPTRQSPLAGGLLAIGGIPDVPYSTPFVSVSITPIIRDTYAFYTIPIDGFSITPPSSPSPLFSLSSSTGGTGRPPFPNTTSTNRTRRQDSPPSAPKTMIIDSGSTLLYLPDDTADYIASLFSPPARYVPASNTYVTSCKAAQPRFGITIGGETFYISPKDMVNPEGRGKCTLAVQRQEDGDSVLGDAWLKNVLVVFDLGNNVVSVAGREMY